MIIHGPVGKNISLPPDSSLLGRIYPWTKGILLSGVEEGDIQLFESLQCL